MYTGSSLETVVGSIAEQRQIFKGADHAFLWKPKLRIPDIYENRENQSAFGNFLDTCVCSSTEPAVLDAVHRMTARERAAVAGAPDGVAEVLPYGFEGHGDLDESGLERAYRAGSGGRAL